MIKEERQVYVLVKQRIPLRLESRLSVSVLIVIHIYIQLLCKEKGNYKSQVDTQ